MNRGEFQPPPTAAPASTPTTRTGRETTRGREKKELGGSPASRRAPRIPRPAAAPGRTAPGAGGPSGGGRGGGGLGVCPRARTGTLHLRILGVVVVSGVVVVDSWKGDKVQEGAESWT